MSIDNQLVEKIRAQAELYYRNGDFYCSEAIVKSVKDAFNLDISDKVIAMASGFPVGIGTAGCTCGALTGGVMALGLFFGRETCKDPRVSHAMRLSKELHDEFKASYKSTCCRVLTRGMDMASKQHLDQCVGITGYVAEQVATIILREQAEASGE